MEKLKVDLNYCYGIKHLKYDFDFGGNKNYLIYAPNGMMKTSFTKTFLALSKEKQPSDEAFNKPTNYSVKDENNNTILAESIFVINSYEDEYFSPNSAKLMARKDLKKSYDTLIEKINILQFDLEKKIKEFFNDPELDIISELTNLYNKTPIDFFKILLEHAKDDLLTQEPIGLDFKTIPYRMIFDENIKKFCSDHKNIKKIEDYSQCYDELLVASPIFKRGIFSQYNADDVINNLSNNRFFEAQHELILNGINTSITTIEELKNILHEEKNKIFKDETLRKKFDKIDAELNKRALVNFRKIIEVHPEIIPLLKNFDEFKKRAIASSLIDSKEYVLSIIEEYTKSQKLIEDIKEQARENHSQWNKVLDIFKSRFSVPFNIEVPNIEDVVLKESIPEFKFEYHDLETGDRAPIARKNLEKILSQGEKRALYLLNIINELEAIRQSGKNMLVITDDIAESFDYKNKYAIIEYIQDLAKDTNLNFVILTHNFDFFRTCANRLKEIIKPRMVSREADALKIENPKYVYKNPFSEIKKGICDNKDKDIITAIPFIRNLIEYSSNCDDDNYKKLTSLLHIKKDTYSITIKELEYIFLRSVKFDFDVNFSKGRDTELVYDLIIKTAKRIVKDGENSIDLDGKIILSMAIRLLAEKFMINEINNVDETGEVIEKIYAQNNQTGKLLEEYKRLCSHQQENILLMNKVLLLSSENIHINSFMFEPIIDISIKSLINLFGHISILT